MSRPGSERRRAPVAAGYLATMTIWAFAIANIAFPSGVAGGVVSIGILLVIQAGTGWEIGRWWAVLLPLGAVVLAIPAGTPTVGVEPFPVWFGFATVVAPAGALVIAAAVALRRFSIEPSRT